MEETPEACCTVRHREHIIDSGQVGRTDYRGTESTELPKKIDLRLEFRGSPMTRG
jgi:hypothetical protein